MGPEGTLTLSWLIRLRWAAIAVQLGLLVLGALGLDLPLPWALLGGLLAVAATSNLALQAWWDSEGPGPRALVGAVLVLDAAVLTGLLYATGGPANPCSALYLLPVTLGASALGSRWGWAMALLVSACDGLLFRWHLPLGHLEHAMTGMGWHLGGMWLGLALSSALIAHFVGRLADALARLRERSAAEARLASLTALAAGAAHELATPLGTIAVVAADLEDADPASLQEDVRLIRAEVQRCRAILDHLAWEGGQLVGETPRRLDLKVWAEAFASAWPRLECDVEEAALHLPERAFAQVLRALVKNAFEASAPEAKVWLLGRRTADGYRLAITDKGTGFGAGLPEPFTSTKEGGLGLGLFLARGFVERLGGSLDVAPRPVGTEVALRFPAEVVS